MHKKFDSGHASCGLAYSDPWSIPRGEGAEMRAATRLVRCLIAAAAGMIPSDAIIHSFLGRQC